MRTLFRQPFSVAFGPMVRRVSCCRDRRGYQGLLGVLARPRALRVRGRVGECFAVREGRRRGSCWRGRSEQSWLVLFSWRGSGLGWALARQRGSMGLVGDSIWKPHRHCITRVRRWAPRKSAAIGPVLTRLRAAVASGSAGFIGSPQWMYSAPSCMTSSAVADRARIPATRTAVVDRARELPHRVQLKAAARVSLRGSMTVMESTRRCRSVSHAAHQGWFPRDWWASGGKYVLEAVSTPVRPRRGSWP